MPSDYCSSDSDLGFEVEMARLDAEAEMLKYFFEHCPDKEYYIPRVVVYHPCMDKQPTPLTRVAVALFDDFDLRWHTEREYRVYDWVDAQVRLVSAGVYPVADHDPFSLGDLDDKKTMKKRLGSMIAIGWSKLQQKLSRTISNWSLQSRQGAGERETRTRRS
ncbi:MAG: hypothetical protein Q9223_004310 [Gallowayella weberi]